MPIYCYLNHLVRTAKTKNQITAVIRSINKYEYIPEFVTSVPVDTNDKYITVIYTSELIDDLWELELRWENTYSFPILTLVWSKLLKDWKVQEHCRVDKLTEWCGVLATYEQFISIINMAMLTPSAYLVPLIGTKHNRWTPEQAVTLCKMIHNSCIYMDIGHIDIMLSSNLPTDCKMEIARLAIDQSKHTKLIATIAAVILHRTQSIFYDRSMLMLRKQMDTRSLAWVINSCDNQQEAMNVIRKIMGCRFKPTPDRYIWELLDEKKYYAIAKTLMLEYFCLPDSSVVKDRKTLRTHLGLQKNY